MSVGSKFRAVMLCAVAALASCHAVAGEMEAVVVDKVIEGYGGQKFENLKSILINSDLRFGWIGQGHTPDFVELEPMKKIHQFDLVNQRASEEAWGNQGAYSEHVFFDEAGQTEINFIDSTYEINADAGYYDHFGGEIRTIDTMIARELLKQRDTANYIKDEYYRGDLHHVLEFDMLETTIDPTLWIHAETGHISLMKREVPDYMTYSYVFEDFRQTGGITYAEDFVLYAGSDVIEYTKSRSIKPNRVKSSLFTVDRGLSPAPESWDTSEMTIEEVTPELHQIGQGGSYSAFFDAGDYLIGLGGYGGLKNRYDAYVEANGEKPLRYLILTHHHSDHIEGAADALDLGATLVMPETARQNVNAAVGSDVPAEKLMILTDEKTTIDGVDIHMISTTHVQNYALLYVPSSKAVFQEDLYNNNIKTRAARVTKTSLSLKTEVGSLGLDVEHILGAHSRKVESWADFAMQANMPVLGRCPSKRPICS